MADRKYYIGLMSGTSADGIDLALVDFTTPLPTLIATSYTPYTAQIREKITTLYLPSSDEIDRLGGLDKTLAHLFAQAVNQLLMDLQLSVKNIIAIGNHGQTIRHRPSLSNQADTSPFTLQIGCNQTLACLTGIEVIGLFRHKDIALGGQGAPLVPAFHQALFTDQLFINKQLPAEQDTFIVNIGGIANITYLPNHKKQAVLGFDTGPGNGLLDEWYQAHHQGGYYDENGSWASTGAVNPLLLNSLLSEPYFTCPAPKSTGREVFNLTWLKIKLDKLEKTSLSTTISPQDIQATLVELTALTISSQINSITKNSKVILCGGGKNNQALTTRLQSLLHEHTLLPIEQLDIDGDALEAMAFAWLAYAYKNSLNSNLPAVTGATHATTLGVLFTP